MDASLRELFDLAIRWIHLIAGIMWVGNSMLFNWLDRSLIKPGEPGSSADSPEKAKLLEGEMWMVHSGGFYHVKKLQLEPSQMPRALHWFKWQSYTTWMTGVGLLVVVYYLGGKSALVDPDVRDLSYPQALAVAVGTLAVGFVTYDLIWRSPLATKAPKGAVALCLVLLGGVIVFLNTFLSGRAAYIHVGAMLGTIMAGNVFFHIVPSQRELVKATEEGRLQDLKLGKHAKQRSIHNNYMTFPVLVMMISNHFSSAYGNALRWAVLVVLCIGGASIRHFMNIRWTFRSWLPALLGSAAATAAAMLFFFTHASGFGPQAGSEDALAAAGSSGEPVSFSAVQIIVNERCIQCHSSHPTDDQFKAPPNNVVFETPQQISLYKERIKARAVISKTMPFGNKTHITPDERNLLARWFLQGAKVE